MFTGSLGTFPLRMKGSYYAHTIYITQLVYYIAYIYINIAEIPSNKWLSTQHSFPLCSSASRKQLGGLKLATAKHLHHGLQPVFQSSNLLFCWSHSQTSESGQKALLVITLMYVYISVMVGYAMCHRAHVISCHALAV